MSSSFDGLLFFREGLNHDGALLENNEMGEINESCLGSSLLLRDHYQTQFEEMITVHAVYYRVLSPRMRLNFAFGDGES